MARMSDPVLVDGSRGEGGGQILRTSLTLSAWLGRPFEISGIRASRPRPGLAAQHLTAVRAAAEICDAELQGAELGSTRVAFAPRELRAGSYRWAVGTAGSTTLVAQTAALPLLRVGAASRLRITGGSHVAWAPSLDYLRDIYAPLLARLGLELQPRLVRYGFYPRGGGEIEIAVGGSQAAAPTPAPRGAPRGLTLQRPPAAEIRVTATAVVSSLRRAIAERMVATAAGLLSCGPWHFAARIIEAHGPPGAYLFVRVHHEPARTEIPPAEGGRAAGTATVEAHTLIAGGFTGLGERGKPAEEVATEAARAALEFLQSDACVDAHLADQLLLPTILAGVSLRFRAPSLTTHLRTNAETMALFLGPCVFSDHEGGLEVRPPDLDQTGGM